jgi:hypothetical protein
MKNVTPQLRVAVCALFMSLSVSIFAQTVVFSDHFDDLTGGTFGNTGTSSMALPLTGSRTGWDLSASKEVYYGGGAIKVGARTTYGKFVTLPMDLSGSFTLSFRAYAWAYDANSIDVLLNGTVLAPFVFPNGPITSTDDLLDYSVSGTGNGNDVISFVQKYPSDRFLLDDIVLTKNTSTAVIAVYTNGDKIPFGANGAVTFDLKVAQQVNIFTPTGLLVKSVFVNSGITSIAVPQGLYVIKTINGASKVVVK